MNTWASSSYEWNDLLGRVPHASEFHSPLMLCQEAVGGFDEYERGWRVILASMMCVRTSRAQSHPTLWRFLAEWPYPSSVALASPDARRRMRGVLRPCGFHNKRTEAIVTMSKNWVMGLRPPDLYGCGPYVESAYRVFVLDDLRFAPEDGHLLSYVSWRLRRRSSVGTGTVEQ